MFKLKALILFLIAFLFIQTGCSDDESGVRTFADFNVVLENTQDADPYKYVISLSEGETAVITKQAYNFEISELRKDTVNHVGDIFTYKPKADFIGTEEIEIEKRSYSINPEVQENKALIKIKITVEKGF